MTKGFKAAACALLGAAWVLAAGWPPAAIARTAFENAVRQAIVN